MDIPPILELRRTLPPATPAGALRFNVLIERDPRVISATLDPSANRIFTGALNSPAIPIVTDSFGSV
jgi:hypothetical protein